MTKSPISLQDLRRRIYVKAKAEPTWRFWGLYVHVCKMETLQEAYQMSKSNNGAPGIDGVTFGAIEESGVEGWLIGAVEKRLREELAKLRVEINEEKSRKVDLLQGEKFGFLGFEYRRVRSRNGKWRTHFVPKPKKRTALLRKLKEIFRRYVSQPVGRVIELINPILRGWVHYFAVGHSSRCFSYIKLWVEKRVRRHLMRARERKGFGWKRWSTPWLYNTLGLFNDYRVVRRAIS
jgi:Group II intron, maturase-specific domain